MIDAFITDLKKTKLLIHNFILCSHEYINRISVIGVFVACGYRWKCNYRVEIVLAYYVKRNLIIFLLCHLRPIL
jgi:hypothetical protein